MQENIQIIAILKYDKVQDLFKLFNRNGASPNQIGQAGLQLMMNIQVVLSLW